MSIFLTAPLFIALLFSRTSALAKTIDNLPNSSFNADQQARILDKSDRFASADKPSLSIDKQSLTLSEKKLSFDLLPLVESQLPNTASKEKTIEELSEQQRVVTKEEPLKKLDQTLVERNHPDLVYVYVETDQGTGAEEIDAKLWQVVDRDSELGLSAALVEVNKLAELAAEDKVKSIRTVVPPVVRAGSVVTEGDAIHQTDEVREIYGQTGSGIKIGVISNGVDHISTAQDSGDLPEDVNVLSNVVGGDEGTAMLEIIHDMVPDAELYFHDCGTNKVAFNNAINDLITAGADVIVDDIGWITEPYFEDGIIASHVESVIDANDIIYVSSAGNSALSHYQGEFYNDGSNYHDFSEGTDAEYRNLYVEVPPGEYVWVVLQWDDESGSSGNDYDLYLHTMDYSQELAKSTAQQDGDDDPLEYFKYTNNGGSSVMGKIDVFNFLGEAETKTLEVYIFSSSGAYNYLNNTTPEDSIFGHPAVPGVISTGAIAADDQGHDDIESFSSRGPITLVDASQRSKPDLTGIDGVSVTGSGGFPSTFYGTSASAPHIAAIIGQLWGKYASSTPEQITSHLLTQAIDIGASGPDYVYGRGRADSLIAFQSAPTTPTPSLSAGDYYGSIFVSLSAAVADSVHYTTDGSSPTCSSTEYSSPVLITNTTTLKAVGCSDLGPSPEMSETYTVNEAASSWYLAEGFTGLTFDTYLLFQNPNDSEAVIDVTYMIDGSENITKQYTVDPNKRFTITAEDDVGRDQAFSTEVNSSASVIVERAMYWDAGGQHWVEGHNTLAAASPASTWYLAEGFTGGSFDTYILIQNPSDSQATVDITYMVQNGENIEKQYTIDPNSRFTVTAEDDVGRNVSFSTQLDSDQPLIVERAMYWDAGGFNWAGGHNTVGTTSPASTWYLAEGFTGGSFDTYILIQNPNETAVSVDVTYMVQNGENITEQYQVEANSRYTITAALDVGRNKSFSTKVETDQPIIVERAMYWDAGGKHWAGGHDTTGTTSPANTWYLAEGFTGGSFDTYALIQNPNESSAVVDVTYMIDGSENITEQYLIEQNTRYTIDTSDDLDGERAFSTEIDSDQPIIVERAMYWDAGGKHWAGGHNSGGYAVTVD